MRGFLVIAVLLVSCVPASDRHQIHTPATKPVGENAYANAVRSLIEAGFTIEEKDETAGIIQTEWTYEKAGGFMPPKRYRWMISIVDGTATVTSQCQEKFDSAESTPWKPCDMQPQKRNDEAVAIASRL